MHFRIDFRTHVSRESACGRSSRLPLRDVDSAPDAEADTGPDRTHDRKDGLTTSSLRVRAYGRRESVTLGTDADGWTMRKAERKLEQVLATWL